MTPYHSKSGKQSGVSAYETGKDYISIRFTDSRIYTYSYVSAGKQAVEIMKKLARRQQGLSTFISKNKPGFE